MTNCMFELASWEDSDRLKRKLLGLCLNTSKHIPVVQVAHSTLNSYYPMLQAGGRDAKRESSSDWLGRKQMIQPSLRLAPFA